MHIEPGMVNGAKMALSFGTVAVALGWTLRHVKEMALAVGILPSAGRTLLATLVVFFSFEVLPHPPVGVSEVHFIFASTLFLLFGLAPTALGLSLGLLLQGLFFAPQDLPMYSVNLTTLLFPLFVMVGFAQRLIPNHLPYQELTYSQVFQLSLLYQVGIISWVAFWALYGQGFAVENLVSIATFGSSYLMVIVVEPLLDLSVLALSKTLSARASSGLLTRRLFQGAV